MRIVYEGRGGYIQIGKARYPIEHVEGGCFAIHFPAGHRHAALASDRAALERLCAGEPERWVLERRRRQPSAAASRRRRWSFDDVDALATSLPGVTVGVKWGHRTWMVGDKGFAWQRPLGKADLKRFGDETPPSGEILAVRVESLDAKEALLAMAPPGFFTIPHFQGYPALLIELRKARPRDVRAAIMDAFDVVAATSAVAARKRR